MCGIAALISHDRCADFHAIAAMSRLVRHRGPDDEGIVLFSGTNAEPIAFGGSDTPADCFAEGHPYLPEPHSCSNAPTDAMVALAHRRLSIVDLSPAGHQPMCIADRRLWIVYNGEVYNYIELRAELEKLGYRFKTRTDTEVMLAAYAQWGRDCLPRFNGMFSFVLFDRANNRLFAARDRFGVKPLYYWISPSGLLAFASEIKQFTVLPGWDARVNGQIAYDFLNWGLSDHKAETFFDGVHQLRNGEALDLALRDLPRALREKRLPIYRWYQLPERSFCGSLSDAAEQFRILLSDAIKLRLRADVAVGSCLSGGLDSSTIVCLMSDLLQGQNAKARQKTFSACSEIARFDERKFVEMVVSRTGVDAHFVYPSLEQLFPTLDAITWHQDEPFGSTSIYAQWHVFALAARNDIKVMLDGQGADEQLAGYHGYFGAYFLELLRTLRWAALWHEIQGTKRLHGYTELWAAKQLIDGLLPESIRQLARRMLGKTSAAPNWLDLGALNAHPVDPFLRDGASRPRSVNELSKAQLTRTNLQMLLHWEDRDSMAHSIEARVPFLDFRVVEFVLSLPQRFKISDGLTKIVLREAMRDTLPEQIRCRTDKLGFVTPEEVWVRERDPDGFRAALNSAVQAAGGILKPNTHEILERVISGADSFSFLIWRWISFGWWMRKFNVRVQ